MHIFKVDGRFMDIKRISGIFTGLQQSLCVTLPALTWRISDVYNNVWNGFHLSIVDKKPDDFVNRHIQHIQKWFLCIDFPAFLGRQLVHVSRKRSGEKFVDFLNLHSLA
jgi:hypothetical protein